MSFLQKKIIFFDKYRVGLSFQNFSFCKIFNKSEKSVETFSLFYKLGNLKYSLLFAYILNNGFATAYKIS